MLFPVYSCENCLGVGANKTIYMDVNAKDSLPFWEIDFSYVDKIYSTQRNTLMHFNNIWLYINDQCVFKYLQGQI